MGLIGGHEDGRQSDVADAQLAVLARHNLKEMDSVELTARIIHRPGEHLSFWHRVWSLQDNTGRACGRMTYNGYRVTYTVEIFSPVHEELSPIACNEFGLRSDGLTWARDQIENLREPTVADYEAAIRKVKDSRYQDELTDDFAYSNGKIARWDRLERELKSRMYAMEKNLRAVVNGGNMASQ